MPKFVIDSSDSSKLKSPTFLVLICALIVLIFFYIVSKLFILNITPSMPLGLYWISHNRHFNRGDTVAICLNPSYQSFGLERNYIIAGNRCHGSEPLIKKILAVPGDDVILRSNDIIVNKRVYPFIILNNDSNNRQLPAWPRGNYQNTEGYWLIGTNDAKSWDSRYWGYINHSQILFGLKPVWIFDVKSERIHQRFSLLTVEDR